MEAKSYEYVDYKPAADLVVSYRFKAKEQVRIIKNGKYRDWVWGHGDNLFLNGTGFPKPPMEKYLEATIKLSIVDVRSNQYVWQIECEQELPTDGIDSNLGKISDMTTNLMAGFHDR